MKKSYRICPCDSYDIEGIQSWLEDLAQEGLFLEEDGVFCGVFTFVRGKAERVAYRLDIAQKQKPRFFGGSDGWTEEEKELYRAMGWEFLLQYGEFRIYRALKPDAPELNTESQTHAMTMGFLKRSARSNWIWAIGAVLFWLVFARSALRYPWLNLAVVGVVFTVSAYGVLLDAVVTPLFRVLRLRKYEKRLLAGESLTAYRDWKKTAVRTYCHRILPIVLGVCIAGCLLSVLYRVGTEFPVEEYPNPPFATLEDVFPGAAIEEDDWLDYGKAKRWDTALAANSEWNESSDITTKDGEKYFCILRLDYHETATEWMAKGLEQDYYDYDANRHRGKRFEDLQAPDLGVDSIRAYNSYGSFYVLMRQGNRVVHAVVLIDNKTNQNQWHLWAEAMAEKLLTEWVPGAR